MDGKQTPPAMHCKGSSPPASPSYRDLGEDVDKQVQHSQDDGNPVATKPFPQVFWHRGDLGTRAELLPPSSPSPPLPKLRSADGLPGILSGRLKREEKMGTKGWGEDELGFCEELCT